MGGEDNGLTLERLAQRLETLERENNELRHQVAELRGLGTRRDEVPALRDTDMHRTEEPASEFEGQVSRRWLLSKAGAAAVGTVAAGALMVRDTHEAEASHSTSVINVHSVNAHRVHTESEGSQTALSALTVSDISRAITGENGTGVGVEGISYGVGPGVQGTVWGSNGTGVLGSSMESSGGTGVQGNGTYHGVRGEGGERGVVGEATNGIGVLGKGKHGVHGTSSTTGWGAVVGVNERDGYGVVGDATSATYSGVWGRNYGVGADVRGESVRNNGVGVSGKGKYGGQFEGGKAQLRLVPGSSAGAPGGAHSKGEVYMDSAATLWVCVAGGNPATWKKVTTS